LPKQTNKIDVCALVSRIEPAPAAIALYTKLIKAGCAYKGRPRHAGRHEARSIDKMK